MIRKIILTCVFILNFPTVQAVAGQENDALLSIRILEKQNLQELEVQSPADKGVWNRIKLARGLLSVNGKGQKEASWGAQGSTVKIKTSNLTRIYPGRIDLSALPGEKGPELLVLNLVPIGDYVACVTACESGYNRSQPEYLKALAVVIRTYASAHRRRHRSYDLCDLSHCQVYQGLPFHFDFWRQMAQAGEFFAFSSTTDPKSIYFHRCCGGTLESADQIWGGTPGSSRTGPDEWEGEVLCRADPLFRWSSSTDAKKIESIFKTMAHLPTNAVLKNFRAVEKTTHGRNKTFAALFEMPGGETREIQENSIRFESEFGKHYGWRVFPSDWFEIKQEGGLFRFTGRGLGHGVGLCQSGALRLSQMGWNWEKILNFYFPSQWNSTTQH